tara:strand:- start:4106 stop:4336 length:231 start_codon:yes stop_codon:yes gene_type:complete
MCGNKLQEVREIILVVLENSSLPVEVDINLETRLREDLGLDSIALAELAVRIEEKYDVDVFENGLVFSVEEVIQKI